MCVCPLGYLGNHTRDLYQIFVHVPYGRGSVLLRQDDEISREGAVLGVFFPIGIVQHSIWDPYKTAKPIDISLRMMSERGLRKSMLRGGHDPRRGNFRKKTCDRQA